MENGYVKDAPSEVAAGEEKNASEGEKEVEPSKDTPTPY